MNKILVKNMLCHRCILSVEDILDRAAIPFYKVLFGEIHLVNEISLERMKNLSGMLTNVGFELIDSHMSGLIEKIKMHYKGKSIDLTNEENISNSAW